MKNDLLEQWNKDLPAVLRGEDPYRFPMKFSGWQTPLEINRANYIWDGIRLCSERTGVPVHELLSDRRDAHTAAARGASINWLLSNYACSVSALARAMNKDHTTVLHWKREHNKKLKDSVYAAYWRSVNSL